METTGGKWLTPEQFAVMANLPMDYVKKLLWPNAKKSTCPKRIDERDLKRYSHRRVTIFYQAPNIAGISRPRLVERK